MGYPTLQFVLLSWRCLSEVLVGGVFTAIKYDRIRVVINGVI